MKISFRTQDDAALSLVILVSIAVLAGGLIYLLTAPQKALQVNSKAKIGRMAQERQNVNNQIKADEAYKKAKVDLVKNLWDIKTEQISPVALNKVTVFATARKLKIQSFRPQRVVSANGVDRVPFQFTVDGNYANVVQLAQDIELSAEKLTVDIIQLSNSDGNTDHVTATIQISAYHKSEGALDV